MSLLKIAPIIKKIADHALAAGYFSNKSSSEAGFPPGKVNWKKLLKWSVLPLSIICSTILIATGKITTNDLIQVLEIFYPSE